MSRRNPENRKYKGGAGRALLVFLLAALILAALVLGALALLIAAGFVFRTLRKKKGGAQ